MNALSMYYLEGFHHIRHYGPLANAGRKKNLVLVRELLQATPDTSPENENTPLGTATLPTFACPDCKSAIIIVDALGRAYSIRVSVIGDTDGRLFVHAT